MMARKQYLLNIRVQLEIWTMVVRIVCTRPVGDGSEVPLLAEEELETESCWEKETEFSLRVRTLEDQPKSSMATRPSIYGSINCTMGKKDTKLTVGRWRCIWEKLGEGKEYY